MMTIPAENKHLECWSIVNRTDQDLENTRYPLNPRKLIFSQENYFL